MSFPTYQPPKPLQVQRARRMRIAMTEPERKLWKAMRWRMPVKGTHFRRQVPIGPYIVDFCCLSAKLIVEVDGNQHGTDETQRYDHARTLTLEAQGFRDLRFSNEDVNRDIDGVLDTITAAMPSPSNQRDHAEIQPHG